MTVGMCGMVITGDVFNLYVFLEVMSLSGYGLIALGGKKSMLAAFRYLLIGTIGASLYLLGVGYMYALGKDVKGFEQGQRVVVSGVSGTSPPSHNVVTLPLQPLKL